MRGKHKIIVQNNRLHYEFEIKRNITVIQGDSATGKTTLINMLRQAENLGQSSGIDVRCDVPCRILEGPHWKLVLENVTGSILFIDEENTFINTEEFASAARGADNYFVLITRENLYNLPYSAEEIYGLHSSGKYQNTRKVYQEMYRIYANNPWLPIDPEKVITEDSNSGYTFFQAICRENGIVCESADGKSNIFTLLQHIGPERTCVIADGAAIGPEMNRLYKQTQHHKNISLYLPESFEWIILKSGVISRKEIQTILAEPEQYIDSKEFFSWERYFTRLLTEETAQSYLRYNKSKLNEAYLHDKPRSAILKSIEGINFNRNPL